MMILDVSIDEVTRSRSGSNPHDGFQLKRYIKSVPEYLMPNRIPSLKINTYQPCNWGAQYIREIRLEWSSDTKQKGTHVWRLVGSSYLAVQGH